MSVSEPCETQRLILLSLFPEPGQLPETPQPPPSLSHLQFSFFHKTPGDLARRHILTHVSLLSPQIPYLPPTSQQELESTVQLPLLSGPEAQAGPFVEIDKRKKAGWGRRINLSTGQTTHLLVVFVSFLSLPWFPLLSFYYLWWEQRILGRDAWWTPRAVTLSNPLSILSSCPFCLPAVSIQHYLPSSLFPVPSVHHILHVFLLEEMALCLHFCGEEVVMRGQVVLLFIFIVSYPFCVYVPKLALTVITARHNVRLIYLTVFFSLE